MDGWTAADQQVVAQVVRKGTGLTLENDSQVMTLDDFKWVLDGWARFIQNMGNRRVRNARHCLANSRMTHTSAAGKNFLLCGSFRHDRRPPLPLPIHVFGGKQDSVRAEQLLDWQADTSSVFSLDMFEGHHFFLLQQEAQLLRCLRRYAEEHLARWRHQPTRPLTHG